MQFKYILLHYTDCIADTKYFCRNKNRLGIYRENKKKMVSKSRLVGTPGLLGANLWNSTWKVML